MEKGRSKYSQSRVTVESGTAAARAVVRMNPIPIVGMSIL